jgi:hypothetical protein
MVRIKELE